MPTTRSHDEVREEVDATLARHQQLSSQIARLDATASELDRACTASLDRTQEQAAHAQDYLERITNSENGSP